MHTGSADQKSVEAAPNTSGSDSLLQDVVYGAASCAILIGGGMMLAWMSRNVWLMEYADWLFFMQFNTAFLAFLGGLGLLARLRKLSIPTMAVGSTILIFGGLTLLEYYMGVTVGIDQILLQDYLHEDSPYPGRMAPNTAIAFICIGAALLLPALHLSRSLLVKEMLGLTPFVLGLVSMAGYLRGISFAYDWGSATRMSIPTSISFIALGTGIVTLAWHKYRATRIRKAMWVSVLLCLAIPLLDISLPLGTSVGVIYVPLIFCSLWFSQPRVTFLFASIASALAVLAIFLKPPSPIDLWIGIFNRIFGIAVLWLVAWLVYLRIRSEHSLKRSEERYELAVQGLSVGIWDWNPGTGDLYWSQRFRAVLGYTETELRNHYSEWEARLHPEDREHTVRMLQGHLQRLCPYDVEYRLRQKNGNYVCIHAKGQAVWDQDGTPLRMVGSIEDITERKEIERQKQEDATYIKTVMNTIVDALLTIDHKGIIQSVNPAAMRLFGYAAEEMMGKNINMLMPEPYRSEHDSYLSNYMTSGVAKVIGIGREVSARNKDGKVFPIDLGINEMRIGDKRMFVGTIRDISPRKAWERDLQKALTQLRKSNDDLETFAYIASHDLKEPLRGLVNNATILKEDYQDTLEMAVHKRLNRMIFLCQRMERLVDDLLHFSRLGRQELAIQVTDLEMVIQDIAMMMETTLHEQNAEIVLETGLPTIICDMPRITEVFRNLITNAVKYNKNDKKRVGIGCCEMTPPGELLATQTFYVRDNGIGISKDFYNDIFRIFKRLNEEDDSVKGTGVGLAFVKKIIERHNGAVWLESEPGVGTTFYFTLGTMEQEEVAHAKPAAYSAR